ncbi:MAG: acetyl-CoA carboxylase biotin carboxylase subunit [Lacisediminimonas sp.]|nr:acetyl-CoA carboxylase biotin carboxylase subunit [Lacisediminimonas sp.]MDO8298720.1 acetyl-CoA carboxylase biotin carboxylase subunit [Lacisediminimonas sp.]
MFNRIYIANRGEIAVRIIRACKSLGIETVVGVSEADRGSLAAQLATRSVCIGPAPSRDSYLRPEILITAALATGCQAVHPGYGFLSERAHFSRLCAENGLVFIGPSPEAIESMGDKLTAVRLADAAGVARVPGSDKVTDVDVARRDAQRIGYPFLFKASAGGGGRGMRLVRTAPELADAMESASAEALAAFGDATVYMEKYIERARHIEIQVLGDSHGNVVHLGERDCSTQRRHQKLIEEAPSPFIPDSVRRKLADDAVRLARQVNYQGAGTVEFVYDEDTQQAYFLEMNTRIQVEHPVTEMITGQDLVAEQIRIAAGQPISFTQEQMQITGHAIECRINAEDAQRNFSPSPGRIGQWQLPAGEGVRVDTHCFEGYMVPPYYDSLLGKLIVLGTDRTDAIRRLQVALDAFVVTGVSTTVDFHRAVIGHADFAEGRVNTRWVEETFLSSRTEAATA